MSEQRDSLWRELDRRVRHIPRYDSAYGRCPMCSHGATIMNSWAGVWWCRCQTCATRWPSRIQSLHWPQPADVNDDGRDLSPVDLDVALEELSQAFEYEVALELALCTELTPAVTWNQGVDDMKRPDLSADDLAEQMNKMEQLVTAVEALALGSPTEPVEAARGALAVLRAAAISIYFPSALTPVSDSALRDFELGIALDGGMPWETIVPHLADLHSQALGGHYDELAQIIRGPRGRRLVIIRAKNAADGDPARTAEATARAFDQFATAIAQQLVAHQQLEPASRVIVETVPRLARLEAVERRHREHAERERVCPR